MPNSTAMLPVTLSLHRNTFLSDVVTSETSSLGPSRFCRDIERMGPSGSRRCAVTPTAGCTSSLADFVSTLRIEVQLEQEYSVVHSQRGDHLQAAASQCQSLLGFPQTRDAASM